jgi:hypothetical protein
MKSGKIGLIACFITWMACSKSFSQIVGSPARPAPTGQVPKAYTGQPARPYSQYQPKPTGQIPPSAPTTIPQENNIQNTEQINQNTQQAAPVTSQEIITVPQQVQTNQQIQTTQPTGEVPKMNTNQDSRTVPLQPQIVSPANPQSVPGQSQTVPQRPNANATP